VNYSRPQRHSLGGAHFDVAVVGGGINGVAIARECARAGRCVLLVEKADFASGTTSRATRIIHGGLRYLEHAEIGLVRESLRERERLLRERPHLVRPMEFVLALPTHGFTRSALAIRVALWLYGLYGGTALAGERAPGDLARFESSLDRGLGLSLFSYEDAQCEYPERLAAEWLTEAMQFGTAARNYTQVLEILVRDGKARGLRIRDLLGGEEAEVTADWIINATGPWADEILQQSHLEQQPLITGVRGSHIILPVFPGAPTSALCTEGSDGRPMFVIPWAGQILVGTTEALQQEPADSAQPTSVEIDYLLSAVQRLYPQAAITAFDIRYSYTGVRPLPHTSQKSLGAISRRHKLHDHLEDGIAGLITVVGGKLTTAASLARSCARLIGVRASEASVELTAIAQPATLSEAFAQWAAKIEEIAGISSDSALALAEWHGPHALAIARMASHDPALQRSLCSHSTHIVAEAVAAVRHEAAVTLPDILLRRVPVALGACWSEECSREAAARIGAALGWSEEEQQTELQRFLEERRRFLHPIRGDSQCGPLSKDSVLLQRAD